VRVGQHPKNIAGAAANSNKVTVSFNQPANFVDVRILEYSGASTTNPVDGTPAGASGSGSLASSGAVVTTAANDLIFGAATTGGVISGAGSGFTLRSKVTPDGDIAEDRTGGTAGSYTATAPGGAYGGSFTWVVQAVAFK
jgi:hypothetical protein